MRPFHTVTVPHEDILEGRLTLDVFAADLWEAYKGRSPAEYSDAATFFRKTYSTQGLRNLFDVIESRLVKGGIGDPVIHLQTPFGGGKTHALIAMYHKSKEWNVKPVVIAGNVMGGYDTVWGAIEEQLTGTINTLSGNVAPNREHLREVIEKNQPVLILMDELLQYVVKAAGVQVQNTNLAAQTMTFIQGLTELAGTLDRTCIVITLPSSALERFDENAEKLYQQLQKIAGRVERVYSPVQQNEITNVIRKRLFSGIDENKTIENVLEFLEYAEKDEGIFSVGQEISEYNDKFEDSFPFLPDVIETLYHRWGSLPSFQRTRGVLRLLSLILNSLGESRLPYVTLSDFKLDNIEIRRELIKHIGPEFDSVISADITDEDSGAKKVDKSLGKSLQGIRLGTRTATAAFMYSFSGGQEKGASIHEIKRSATTIENPSSFVVESLEQLKARLFFIQSQNERVFFSNQPNLNRIIFTRMENIKDKDLIEEEKKLIIQNISDWRSEVRVCLWPDNTKDIPDTEQLKFVVLLNKEDDFIMKTVSSKGESPRIHRNTIVFLAPLESEKSSFLESLKRVVVYRQIKNDRTLNLTEEQQEEVEEDMRIEDSRKHEILRKLYRVVYVPTPGNAIVKEVDLGIPDISQKKGIVQDAYDGLRTEGEIIERISPVVIKEKYLKGRDYTKIQQIYDSMMKTPGEVRFANKRAIDDGIKLGVKQGLFGLGEIQYENNESSKENPLCRYFKENITTIDENNIILIDRICESQMRHIENKEQISTSLSDGINYPNVVPNFSTATDNQTMNYDNSTLTEIMLNFDVPRGKISHMMGIMHLLQQKFETVNLQIRAEKGSMSEHDYQNKIKEALKQLGIDID